MPLRLEGYIDDGRGEPLADIPAVATILGTSTVVDTTITDDDGHWLFTGLPTANEYVVTLSDPAGNAVSRSVWSGEMRELWVRDRLDVAGLPVALDPAAGNALLWSATGLYAAGGISQAAADLRYEPLDSAYTKAEADALFLTPAAADALFLTAAEADALFLTPAEGNTAYATAAHNHDATYVQLTGGSVMTGLLGPSTHNTRDLGTTGTRWRALYGMTGDFTTSLTVATKPITPSPDAANIIEFRANGLYAAAGAVTDIWVNTGGDTMTGDLNMTANVLPTVTNVRSLGSTSLRWLKVWATDADFTNAPTVGGAALLTSTTADALFLTPAEGNAAYATTAHAHDAAYVNVTGDTMSGDLAVVGTLAVGAAVTPLGELTVKGGGGGNTDLALIEGDSANGYVLSTLVADDSFVIQRFVSPVTYSARLMISSAGLLSALGGLAVTGAATVSTGATLPGAFTDRLLVIDDADAGIRYVQVNTAGGPSIRGLRARGTVAAPTRALAGDELFAVRGFGRYGTTDGDTGGGWGSLSASIVLQASEPFTSTARGSYMYFATTPTGTVTPANRLLIDGAGVVNALTALQVNSRPVIMAGCRVYNSVTQTITTGTLTALTYNTERYDTDGFHDTVTNNSRLTVPAGLAGKYHIFACGTWVAVADATWRLIGLRVNGTTQIGRQGGPNLSNATFQTTQNVSCVYDLAAGDYVEAVVRHERGSNLDIGPSPNIDEFGLQRIG